MSGDHHHKVPGFSTGPPEYTVGQPSWNVAIPKELSQKSSSNNYMSSSGTSTPRKRTRSFTMETIPPLPKITGDSILEVFTHRSLRYPGAPSNELFGDNERLAVLGAKALDTAVIYALFCKKPLRSAEELQTEAADALSNSNVDHWLTVYRLREKVRCTSDVISSLKSPQEGRLLFTSYVGAVFAQNGMNVVQDWVGKLLEPPSLETSSDLDPFSKRVKNEPTPIAVPPPHASSPAFSMHQAHYNQHQSNFSSPLVPPQPTNPPPPLPSGNQPISFLPMFNQTANQRRLGVEYAAQFFGPPHAGRWTVKCLVNGIEKGQGMGSSKQLAKEEAAKQAFYAMGWAAW